MRTDEEWALELEAQIEAVRHTYELIGWTTVLVAGNVLTLEDKKGRRRDVRVEGYRTVEGPIRAEKG